MTIQKRTRAKFKDRHTRLAALCAKGDFETGQIVGYQKCQLCDEQAIIYRVKRELVIYCSTHGKTRNCSADWQMSMIVYCETAANDATTANSDTDTNSDVTTETANSTTVSTTCDQSQDKPAPAQQQKTVRKVPLLWRLLNTPVF